MASQNRGRIIWGLLLVFFGLYLLAVQFFPALRGFAINQDTWPLLIVALGVAFLLVALLAWRPVWMIPAAIVGGIGAILFWQNLTGNWTSWAYLWTWIPGLIGIGVALMYLMQGNLRQAIVQGGALILLSLAAFLLVGSFYGAIGMYAQYWPLLLILLGVIVLAQAFWRRA